MCIRCAYTIEQQFMSDDTKHTGQLPQRHIAACPECGYVNETDVKDCVQCGTRLPRYDPTTTLIRRDPLILPTLTHGKNVLPDTASVVLQFLPSGVCEIVALKTPLLLGRAVQTNPPNETEHPLFDLSEFQAHHHGVSRRHCLLERRDERLLVTDLGSTNGTYLNEKRLLPQNPLQIAHGDRLILGTLHLIVYYVENTGQFFADEPPPDPPTDKD
jgi:hypothetical protein